MSDATAEILVNVFEGLQYWWPGATFLLSCIALVATLRATKTRYWIAFSAYALIVLCHAVIVLFPMFWAVHMAGAIGVRSVAPVQTHIFPWLALAFFALPVFALLPVMSQPRARRIAAILFGGALSVAIISSILMLLTSPREFRGPPYGQLTILLVLLWLRIDNIRPKLPAAEPADGLNADRVSAAGES